MQKPNLARQLETFLNLLDVSHQTFWKRAHRKCLESRIKTWKAIGRTFRLSRSSGSIRFATATNTTLNGTSCGRRRTQICHMLMFSHVFLVLSSKYIKLVLFGGMFGEETS